MGKQKSPRFISEKHVRRTAEKLTDQFAALGFRHRGDNWALNARQFRNKENVMFSYNAAAAPMTEILLLARPTKTPDGGLERRGLIVSLVGSKSDYTGIRLTTGVLPAGARDFIPNASLTDEFAAPWQNTAGAPEFITEWLARNAGRAVKEKLVPQVRLTL